MLEGWSSPECAVIEAEMLCDPNMKMQWTIFGIESAEFTHGDVCDAALMHAGAYAGTGNTVGLLEPRQANKVAVLRELKRRGYAEQRSML